MCRWFFIINRKMKQFHRGMLGKGNVRVKILKPAIANSIFNFI